MINLQIVDFIERESFSCKKKLSNRVFSLQKQNQHKAFFIKIFYSKNGTFFKVKLRKEFFFIVNIVTTNSFL